MQNATGALALPVLLCQRFAQSSRNCHSNTQGQHLNQTGREEERQRGSRALTGMGHRANCCRRTQVLGAQPQQGACRGKGEAKPR